jgi:hypothetical protein
MFFFFSIPFRLKASEMAEFANLAPRWLILPSAGSEHCGGIKSLQICQKLAKTTVL